MSLWISPGEPISKLAVRNKWTLGDEAMSLRHGVCAACIGYGLSAVFGCWGGDPCPTRTEQDITIVLTFDDGPLAADLAISRLGSPDDLLDPLQDILKVLDERQSRAVFFIEGPGRDDIDDRLEEAFADGIAAIHDAGHVLGYHGFTHDLLLWANPLSPPIIGYVGVTVNLERLVIFLDDALGRRNLSREAVFEPLFRQPFGGSGFSRTLGWLEAGRRGWTYRGFMIDSIDWLDNVEVDPSFAAALSVSSEDEYVEFVLDNLRSGVNRNPEQSVVDVLLHVNRFTARHLEAWIGEIETAVGEIGGAAVTFDVPDCYLRSSNLTVDRAILGKFSAVGQLFDPDRKILRRGR